MSIVGHMRGRLIAPFVIALVPGAAAPAGAAPAAPPCRAAQVSGAAFLAGGGAGHAWFGISLHDHGGPCTLRGYPRVRLLDRQHLPLGTLRAPTRQSSQGRQLPLRTVRLTRASAASFEIGYTEEPSVIGPDNRACEVVPFLGIDLAGGRVDVATEITPCGGRFDQSPIVAGMVVPRAHD